MERWKPVVYVVDDEELIARTLALILNRAGYRTFSFPDAKQAVAATESDISPDLLLSDVVMPGMSGIELAIKFRHICPQCRVLLFTGESALANDLESAQQQGYTFEILHKPIHPADLLARIHEQFSPGIDEQAIVEELPAAALSTRSLAPPF